MKVIHRPSLGKPGTSSVVLHSLAATAKSERDQETVTARPKLRLMAVSHTTPSLKKPDLPLFALPVSDYILQQKRWEDTEESTIITHTRMTTHSTWGHVCIRQHSTGQKSQRYDWLQAMSSQCGATAQICKTPCRVPRLTSEPEVRYLICTDVYENPKKHPPF